MSSSEFAELKAKIILEGSDEVKAQLGEIEEAGNQVGTTVQTEIGEKATISLKEFGQEAERSATRLAQVLTIAVVALGTAAVVSTNDLLKMPDAISQMSDQGKRDMYELHMATTGVKDETLALRLAVAEALSPSLTELANILNTDVIPAMTDFFSRMGEGRGLIYSVSGAIRDTTEEYLTLMGAMGRDVGGIEDWGPFKFSGLGEGISGLAEWAMGQFTTHGMGRPDTPIAMQDTNAWLASLYEDEVAGAGGGAGARYRGGRPSWIREQTYGLRPGALQQGRPGAMPAFDPWSNYAGGPGFSQPGANLLAPSEWGFGITGAEGLMAGMGPGAGGGVPPWMRNDFLMQTGLTAVGGGMQGGARGALGAALPAIGMAVGGAPGAAIGALLSGLLGKQERGSTPNNPVYVEEIKKGDLATVLSNVFKAFLGQAGAANFDLLVQQMHAQSAERGLT